MKIRSGRQGFIEFYFNNLKNYPTHKETYLATEEAYAKAYGKPRYKNYASFRSAMSAPNSRIARSQRKKTVKSVSFEEFYSVFFNYLSVSDNKKAAYNMAENWCVENKGSNKHKSYKNFLQNRSWFFSKLNNSC